MRRIRYMLTGAGRPVSWLPHSMLDETARQVVQGCLSFQMIVNIILGARRGIMMLSLRRISGKGGLDTKSITLEVKWTKLRVRGECAFHQCFCILSSELT